MGCRRRWGSVVGFDNVDLLTSDEFVFGSHDWHFRVVVGEWCGGGRG